MSDLFQFQKDLVDFILHNKTPDNLLKQIHPGGKNTALESLEIHKEGYFARLTEVLGDTFAAVWWVLGDDEFFKIAEDFIKKNPSLFYDLNEYGEKFSDTLKNSEFSFLSDLAKFEWLYQKVFHMPGHTPIESTELPKVADPEYRIIFGDSVCLFASDYNVYSVWKQKNNNDDVLNRDEISKPNWLLLYKVRQQFYVYQLTQTQFLLMQDLLETQNLSDAIENANYELVESDVASLFQIIGSEGLVKQVLHKGLSN